MARPVSKLAVIPRRSLPQIGSFIRSAGNPRAVVIFLEILVLIHHIKKKSNEFSSVKSNAAGKISTNQFSVEIFSCWLKLLSFY